MNDALRRTAAYGRDTRKAEAGCLHSAADRCTVRVSIPAGAGLTKLHTSDAGDFVPVLDRVDSLKKHCLSVNCCYIGPARLPGCVSIITWD